MLIQWRSKRNTKFLMDEFLALIIDYSKPQLDKFRICHFNPKRRAKTKEKQHNQIRL